MTLQDELIRLPKNAITILRFMSQQTNYAADYMEIRRGTGLSDRAAGKSVKRLVTRFFMHMDESRVYHLTPKGEQSNMLLASDANLLGDDDPDAETIAYDLCAVVPQQIIGGVSVPWVIGVSPLGNDTPEYPTELVLILSADNGTISPDRATLNVSGNIVDDFAELTLTADGSEEAIRIRVEAYQLLELDEPNTAGGMYFDVPVSGPSQDMRAVHSQISLL
jgi:hypothetical protein